MVDFLKTNPAFSLKDLIWNLSAPFVRIMMADATQVIPLTDKQAKKIKLGKKGGVKRNETTDNPDVFAAALGIPSF